MPSTVGTTTISGATATQHQRKCFYANGRFWVFYSNGTNMVYCTSLDGVSWTSPTTIRACVTGGQFCIWFDDTYLHYVYATSTPIYYRRGTPDSDGNISWSAVEQTVHTEYDKAYYLTVAVDSSRYVWIAYRDYLSPNYTPWVIKSGNNDGTWGTTPSGFPHQLSTVADLWWRVTVVPLTSLKMYVIYTRNSQLPLGKLWNGTSWGSEENDVADYPVDYGYRLSALSMGDDVHFAYLRDVTPQIRYNIRTYTVGWGVNDVLVQDSVLTASVPTLSVDDNDDIYCFWAHGVVPAVTNHYYYKRRIDGTWDTNPIDWVNESDGGIYGSGNQSCFQKQYGYYIGMAYVSGIIDGHNVRFMRMSFAPKDVVVTDGIDATRIVQQRKVFRNPRGQGYYYAFVENPFYTWGFYKSVDGISWYPTDIQILIELRSPSLWIHEDVPNDRLLVYIATIGVAVADQDVDVRCYKIDDGTTRPELLWHAEDVGVKTDDTHFATICLAGNGYLWVVWADEYVNKGKIRGRIRARCSTSTYPTSEPTWTSVVEVFDTEVNPDGMVSNGTYPKPSVIPLTATANVAITWSIRDITKSYYLYGKTGSYNGTGNPTVGTLVEFTTPAPSMGESESLLAPLHSIVAESGVDSDVFVLFVSSTLNLICEKWDVSANTKSSFGTLYAGDVDSLVLSIDKTSSPDNLFAFYHVVTGDVNYKVSGVDAVDWSSEETIDDDTETLDYLSSTYEDWKGDGEIQVVYIRQTTLVIRHAEVSVVVVPPKELKYSHTVPIRYIKPVVIVKRNGEIIAYRTPYTPYRTERPIQPEVV